MRALVSRMNTENKPIYPRLSFLELASHLQKPQVQEGFADVLDIDFTVGELYKQNFQQMRLTSPEWHGTEEDAKVWNQHWL
jgi:hypothetical protein